jgi:hypothetical protein
MIRWIASDDETAEAVVSRFKRGAAEIHSGNLMGAALELKQATLLILPSSTPGTVLVARIKPRPDLAPDSESESVNLEPVGFLGLQDMPVFSKPPAPAHKNRKWWQRRSA